MNRIAEILEKKGIKQTWLADQIGKGYNMVNSYVCNRRQPSIEILFKIAEKLNVKPHTLIKGSELAQPNAVDWDDLQYWIEEIVFHNKENSIKASEKIILLIKQTLSTKPEPFIEGERVYVYDVDGKKCYGTIQINTEYKNVSEWYIKYDDLQDLAVLDISQVYKAEKGKKSKRKFFSKWY